MCWYTPASFRPMAVGLIHSDIASGPVPGLGACRSSDIAGRQDLRYNGFDRSSTKYDWEKMEQNIKKNKLSIGSLCPRILCAMPDTKHTMRRCQVTTHNFADGPRIESPRTRTIQEMNRKQRPSSREEHARKQSENCRGRRDLLSAATVWLLCCYFLLMFPAVVCCLLLLRLRLGRSALLAHGRHQLVVRLLPTPNSHTSVSSPPIFHCSKHVTHHRRVRLFPIVPNVGIQQTAPASTSQGRGLRVSKAS